VAVDAADARHHAVAGSLLDQLLQAAPRALCCKRERSVLDERTWIAEIFDVLARRALLGGPTTRNCLRPLGVQRTSLACLHFGEVAADVIEIDALRDLLVVMLDVRCTHSQKWRAFEHCVA